MIRLLIFILVVLGLGAGFAWLADRPGDVLINWQGEQIQMSVVVAAGLIVALVAAVMLLWWIIRTLLTSPHLIRRHLRTRRRDRGYQALSTGLIAAGAGDSVTARKMHRRTQGLINARQEPLIHLLEAQTALIEGDHDAARRKFESMAEDPETRALALRGLYLEARRAGAEEAAQHYVERAVDASPQLPWAAQAALEFRSREGDWDGAIRLLERQRMAHIVKRDEAERKKAVLLTARAMKRLDGDPRGARDDALEAARLAPDLVPAAVTAAKALFREDNVRKGSKVLEKSWRNGPHPEVSEAYVRARIGDSVRDRLKRAERLEQQKPNQIESLLVVARAALDAQQFRRAREKAEAAARQQSRESIYLLLADIEEAETGDQGRVRHWLAQAVRAQPDPAWTADGYVSEKWAPVSPVTGKLDAFVWRVPLERLSAQIEGGRAHTDQIEQAIRTLPPVREPVIEAKAPASEEKPLDAEIVAPAEEMPPTTQTEPEVEEETAKPTSTEARPATDEPSASA
ncbi:MAG TPA: heme biosynthesis protein HemY, partial [Pararhizobium sp.]|nr:heme biosynthesis protein HemY [Pararhizobium sp.]